jgi:hypothetical protein
MKTVQVENKTPTGIAKNNKLFLKNLEDRSSPKTKHEIMKSRLRSNTTP